MATIAGVDLGKIFTETTIKESGFLTLPLPLSDSDSVDVLDLEGAQKLITIRGVLTGDTAAALRTARDNIDAIIDGDQITTKAYINSTTYPSPGIKTKLQRFETNWSAGRVGDIEYTLNLIQAAD